MDTVPRLDPAAFPPAVAELLRVLPLAPLGPGTPNEAMRPALEALTDLPATCRAGLWLAFDFLDESHRISQDVSTPDGSYWHAIMHRREPDAANSKYWWRQVGRHPVLELLTEHAPTLGYCFTDPAAFVDYVEAVRGGDESIARQVQALEWRLLFEYCHRRGH